MYSWMVDHVECELETLSFVFDEAILFGFPIPGNIAHLISEMRSELVWDNKITIAVNAEAIELVSVQGTAWFASEQNSARSPKKNQVWKKPCRSWYCSSFTSSGS